ncbi:oligosaccharide repeat unit polymerase [Vibrio sp. SS-MA-C1-2]|uniref:O-antigen polymerase n=1 Tax=Vibrio sp. SS-MA-C1-2 TaxID=2908646 RepID=UPI001F1CF1E8|nr:O-antigen polymerase [Vibrio sp. SS-MA-C1-2]UJF18551.1 oligosaccharide repeat unit polymerase [Vibrio sp. SS-MA-C1-2]
MIYIIFNPLLIFSLSLLLSLLSTYLGWSDLFDKVGSETINIYLVSSLFGIIVGLGCQHKISKILKNESEKILCSFKYSRNDKYLVILIFTFFIAEYVYSGFLPIFVGNYDNLLEMSFGLPLIHGLYLSFISYISIVYFQKYQYCRRYRVKNNYLLYVFLFNLLFLLLARRGTIVFNVICYFFIFAYYYISSGKSLKKLVGVSLLFAALFLFGFNYVGNVRLGKDSTDYILDVGKASSEFKDSYIPKPFFFGYLYISTPVNIFDVNRNNHDETLNTFLLNNIIPDFLTKRIGFNNEIEVVKVNGFNVGGIFLESYMYKGILGVVLIFLYYICLYLWVLYFLTRASPRALVGLVIFLSISLLLSFQNLLNASGYILQFYYALFFITLSRLNYGSRKLLPIRKNYD